MRPIEYDTVEPASHYSPETAICRPAPRWGVAGGGMGDGATAFDVEVLRNDVELALFGSSAGVVVKRVMVQESVSHHTNALPTILWALSHGAQSHLAAWASSIPSPCVRVWRRDYRFYRKG